MPPAQPERATEKFAPLCASEVRESKYPQLRTDSIRSQKSPAAQPDEAAHKDDDRRQLERRYEDLERFAAMAAHDLNAPLRQIAQMTEILRISMVEKLDALDLSRFEQIDQRLHHLQHLVTALLAHSSAANAPLAIEQVSLDSVIAQIREDLAPIIAEARAQIIHDPLPQIDADPVLIPQLFTNLISNSIKYCRDGAPPRIRIYQDHDDSAQSICIEDNGIGVDPAFASRIFDPFMRIGSKPETQGTGIGLAIVKMIAAKHHWPITMHSIVGTGSTVRITLTPPRPDQISPSRIAR